MKQPMPDNPPASQRKRGRGPQPGTRYVRHTRQTCGVKATATPGGRNRKEDRDLRAGYSDFLREHKSPLRMPASHALGKTTPATTGATPKLANWQPRFLAALERTGDPEEACRRAGATLEVLKQRKRKDKEFADAWTAATTAFRARARARDARRARIHA